VQYLGIGPGAHSFNGEQRRWCSQRLEDYVLSREFQGEQLSLKDKYNELIMTSLRRVEGISLSDVERSFGEECRKRLVSRAARWIDTGDLSLDGDSLYIPTSRFLISDAVIESLFDE
jgi:oxygen-independent coproporphyrinogen-3 oxidase